MSDLRWSLEVKDGRQNGQSSEGRGLHESAWASVVLMCSGGRGAGGTIDSPPSLGLECCRLEPHRGGL